MTNKVSVIIPTYNRKHLLGYTLNNILKQSLSPYEIIVVDDHSSDGTKEWLFQNFPNVIVLANNGKGPGAARNTGLQRATGDYIQFFDSDDLMTINKIQIQVEMLGGYNDTFVYGPYAIGTAFPDEWQLTDAILQYSALPDANLMRWIYRGWCSITQACLFPKALINKVGLWSEDIYTHEDREYWSRIAKEIKRAPIHENQSCTLYRQHTNQLTLASEKMDQRSQDSIFVDRLIKNTSKAPDFLSAIYLTSRIASSQQYMDRLQQGHTTKTKQLKALLHRLLQKHGRIKSGNNWQPMHGASTNLEYFNQYVAMFSV